MIWSDVIWEVSGYKLLGINKDVIYFLLICSSGDIILFYWSRLICVKLVIGGKINNSMYLIVIIF